CASVPRPATGGTPTRTPQPRRSASFGRNEDYAFPTGTDTADGWPFTRWGVLDHVQSNRCNSLHSQYWTVEANGFGVRASRGSIRGSSGGPTIGAHLRHLRAHPRPRPVADPHTRRLASPSANRVKHGRDRARPGPPEQNPPNPSLQRTRYV